MGRLIKSRSHKLGKEPGTMLPVGETGTPTVPIRVVTYSPEALTDETYSSLSESAPLPAGSNKTWIQVVGSGRVDAVQQLGSILAVPALFLEDILNTDHRPKMEECPGSLVIIVKAVLPGAKGNGFYTEQVSLVLGESVVISVVEQESSLFSAVRQRLNTSDGRLRTSGADYLAYALMDSIVDNYFVVLEVISERLEQLEAGLLRTPARETLHEIQLLKRDIILLRRIIWPLRDLIYGLQRYDGHLISADTGQYLRDLHDHIVQVVDTVDMFRELVAGMQDIYLSSMSNRMNEIMKVLTIVTTIFIPLTFIAGIYGMNFEIMPELAWRWGYPAVLLIMAVLAVAMVFFVKRRRWL